MDNYCIQSSGTESYGKYISANVRRESQAGMDDEETGNVRLQRKGLEFETGPYEICREDLAAVLLDIVENSDDSNSIINVTWGKNR